MSSRQLSLLSTDAISDGFDPTRLTQARRLAGLTKRTVAEQIGVSPVAVGQWEAGTARPRPDNVAHLADVLDVPTSHFAVGRPYARLDSSAAHFRSLRKTPALQRQKAIAFTEQLWELVNALEKRVQMRPVDLPGFSAGEVLHDWDRFPTEPVPAAQALRRHWEIGPGCIHHLVRTIERHGIIVAFVSYPGATTIDAFSTSHLPRPIVVLTPNRTDDVYRHRFTTAHELGHLVMHSDCAPGDLKQEREADAFAAEFLTPRTEIAPLLPARLDLKRLELLSQEWGVSVESLLYRCREVEAISEATYRRAFQRINQLRSAGLFRSEPVKDSPGEVPILLKRAFAVAEQNGLTMEDLADELRMKLPRLRGLLGEDETDQRPTLRLV